MFQTIYDIIYLQVFDFGTINPIFMGHEYSLILTYIVMTLIFLAMIKFVFFMFNLFKIV